MTNFSYWFDSSPGRYAYPYTFLAYRRRRGEDCNQMGRSCWGSSSPAAFAHSYQIPDTVIRLIGGEL